MTARRCTLTLLLSCVGCAPADLYPLEDPPAPIILDMDGDGFPDDLEYALGSDPTNPFSWAFGSGDWPDFTPAAEADGLKGEGYDLGMVMKNFRGDDQFGGRASLHQFYGYVVILDFVAGWCAPCDTVAAQSQPWWVDVREEGVLVVHLVVDDEDGYGAIDTEFPDTWAERYGLEFPVLLDDSHKALEGFGSVGLYQDAVPFTVVLDKKMRVDSAYTGIGGSEEAQDRATELL